jgi:4-amino-4-deoxychorismate lyase
MAGGTRVLNWKHHYRRLAADCALLGLALPEEKLLLDEIARVAPETGATVKVIVTRGAAGRGYAPTAGGATRVVAAFPLPPYPPGLAIEGVRIRRCALILSQQPRLAGAKTLNRLENVLARGEWDDPAIHEGMLCDGARRLIEGTMSNVFLVRGGRVATPDLARCGVIGAQRERVRELLAAEKRVCDVRDIEWRELEEAEEVFLTNSLIGIWPVTQFEHRRWRVGPITRALQERLANDDEAH